jgi:hypothetical protein
VLPHRWQDRTYKLQNANTRDFIGWCLEGHDLAASKLAAFRDKDRDFVRVLLVEGLIDADVLLERVELMDLVPELRERMVLWIRALAAELIECVTS